MAWLVWSGAVLTVAGLVGILWSARMVFAARRAAKDDADMRARMQRILPMNLGALFVSVIGLMAVILGVSLG